MVRILVCLLILAAACGKSGTNGNGPNGPNASIALSLSRNALAATQGGSDNLTASITRPAASPVPSRSQPKAPPPG